MTQPDETGVAGRDRTAPLRRVPSGDHEYQYFQARVLAYIREAEALDLGRVMQPIVTEIKGQLAPKNWYSVSTLLRELRQMFCRHLSFQTLLGIVEDIEDDLQYLGDQRRRTTEELRKVRADMVALLKRGDGNQQRGDGVVTPEEATIRGRLESLSRKAALSFEEAWQRAVWTRDRLNRTQWVLVSRLVIFASGLAFYSWWTVSKIWPLYLFATLMGGVGGAVSSLTSSESKGGHRAAFFNEQRFLYVRPLVGSVLGLLALLALSTRAISSHAFDFENYPLGALVVAFAAGFMERLFVAKLLKTTSP
jgi:hypothetical protein